MGITSVTFYVLLEVFANVYTGNGNKWILENASSHRGIILYSDGGRILRRRVLG